jgi:hypothetical protein
MLSLPEKALELMGFSITAIENELEHKRNEVVIRWFEFPGIELFASAAGFGRNADRFDNGARNSLNSRGSAASCCR